MVIILRIAMHEDVGALFMLRDEIKNDVVLLFLS